MTRLFTKRSGTLGRALALTLLGALIGEATVACRDVPPPATAPLFVPAARTGTHPLLVVVTPENERVTPLLRTLEAELRGAFELEALYVPRFPNPRALGDKLDALRPRAVLLVDNSAVQLYAPVAARSASPPPALIVMASFVRELTKLVKNSTAIEFEPSAVTTLTEVRELLGREIRRAGVVYREGFEEFIEEEKRRAARESIELVAIVVPSEPNVDRVSRALRRLEQSRVDAVWVTNDNALLSRRLLAKVWVPFAKQAKLPIAVGVPSLVTSRVPFGTYAAVPDTVGLGVQAADRLLEIARQDFRTTEVPVEPAVAIRTYLNVDLSRAFGGPLANESRVDVLIHGGEIEEK